MKENLQIKNNWYPGGWVPPIKNNYIPPIRRRSLYYQIEVEKILPMIKTFEYLAFSRKFDQIKNNWYPGGWVPPIKKSLLDNEISDGANQLIARKNPASKPIKPTLIPRPRNLSFHDIESEIIDPAY